MVGQALNRNWGGIAWRQAGDTGQRIRKGRGPCSMADQGWRLLDTAEHGCCMPGQQWRLLAESFSKKLAASSAKIKRPCLSTQFAVSQVRDAGCWLGVSVTTQQLTVRRSVKP